MTDYGIEMVDGGAEWRRRLLVGTPVTGLVRVEWVRGRYGQIIPPNWGMREVMQFVGGVMPLRLMVGAAQDVIAAAALRGGFEWLLLLEHDVVLPPDAFGRLNRHMETAEFPVVSGLYYSRGQPSEPLVFRGEGWGSFLEWELGDLVAVDRVATGILLIHCSILRTMWGEAEAYTVGGQTVRRIFGAGTRPGLDPETGAYDVDMRTSDLIWSRRVQTGDILARAGWEAVGLRDLPFIVDTGLFCGHIEQDGRIYPEGWGIGNGE